MNFRMFLEDWRIHQNIIEAFQQEQTYFESINFKVDRIRQQNERSESKDKQRILLVKNSTGKSSLF
jgi:hypothetical protein